MVLTDEAGLRDRTGTMADRVVRFAELTDFIARIFVAAGASEQNARVCAAHIAGANLCGVDTHGAWQVAGYVNDIRAGLLVPDAAPRVVREQPGALLVAGGWTFGQVAAEFAVLEGLKRLQDQAVVLTGVVQCHHLGRVGHYPELAAERGAIAVVCGGGYGVGSPITVPFGGRDPVFNTNPFAYAAPAPDGRVMADFATTAGANARVRIARERGEPLPEGFAVDAEGRSTTDAEAVAAGGSLLPFGGHKGYALMTLIEVLSRIVMGGDDYAEAGRGGPVYGHQGVCMLLLRPDVFRPAADYRAGVADLADALRGVRPAPGVAEVLAPGDPERRTRAERAGDGIPLPPDVWQSLLDTATAVGVDPP
jgi:LDH2 family malate/lactate/ureidoglycolate dehydrogenase